MLYAVPKRLEFSAMENRLARSYRAPLVGVLDLQSTGEFMQHLGDLCALCHESLGYGKRVVLKSHPERILYPPVPVDVTLCLKVFPQLS